MSSKKVARCGEIIFNLSLEKAVFARESLESARIKAEFDEKIFCLSVKKNYSRSFVFIRGQIFLSQTDNMFN
jgi:hypothetical protein